MEKHCTWFERAIFVSWYCAKPDCTFCYMSTQKTLITDPRAARRSLASILAEAIITKACNWKIEFVSGGINSYGPTELAELLRHIHTVYGKKIWLNMGVFNEAALKKFQPYLEGVCGTIETINPKVHDEVCPNKPVGPTVEMFRSCEKIGLKKSMTIIIGLGETIEDFPMLKDFIEKNRIDKITFYALNPIKGTIHKKGPEPEYYIEWIRKTRQAFPDMKIIAGPWVSKVHVISQLLKAGADAITKFPALKLFNSEHAKEIVNQCRLAGKEFIGAFTEIPKINIEEELKNLELSQQIKDSIKLKVEEYLETMRKDKSDKILLKPIDMS